MATHSVPAGAIGSPAFTLTANEVSTVTFAEDLPNVEVISDDGAASIWWTCDGSTPAAGSGWYIPASLGTDDREPPTSGPTVVKLWSAGTPTVRVQRGG